MGTRLARVSGVSVEHPPLSVAFCLGPRAELNGGGSLRCSWTKQRPKLGRFRPVGAKSRPEIASRGQEMAAEQELCCRCFRLAVWTHAVQVHKPRSPMTIDPDPRFSTNCGSRAELMSGCSSPGTPPSVPNYWPDASELSGSARVLSRHLARRLATSPHSGCDLRWSRPLAQSISYGRWQPFPTPILLHSRCRTRSGRSLEPRY